MKQFKNILCVIEQGEACKPSLARAVCLAENNQARLTVAAVIPDVPAEVTTPEGKLIDIKAAMTVDRMHALELSTEPYREGLSIQHIVLVGTEFLEIIRAVLRNGHDLVVKRAENPNLIARLFGSSDMHLLRKCPSPVWLTHLEEKSNYGCILAAVDFDPQSPSATESALNQQILQLAGSLAISDFAALHLVHVWDAPGELTVRAWSDNPDAAAMSYVEGERLRHERVLNQLNEQLKEQLGQDAYNYLSPQFHLRRGAASTVIPEAAQQLRADLVVMGTVARTGIAGLLIGNTAESILEQLSCSVLAVKPPGFVSPVKLAD